MADDDRNRGYRDNDAYGRQRPQPAQPTDDPLAELARLIGQQNESAPSYRQKGARSPYGDRHDAPAEQTWSAPDPYAEQDYRQDYRQDAAAPRWPAPVSDHASSHADQYGGPPAAYGDGQAYGNGQYDARYDTAPQSDPGYGSAPYTPSYGDARYAEPHQEDPRYSDPRYADPRYSDPRYADPRYADPRYADPRYADPRYADPRYAEPRYDEPAQGYSDPRYADPNFGAPQFAAQPYAADPHYQQGGEAQGYAPYAQDGGETYANSYYGTAPAPVVQRAADERPTARRRGSIVTVLAVLALAVVGTAAAFGYRAMFATAGTPVPPPVITADTKPSKVVPATDPNAKPIQDRVGVKTEKIVPREEEPVQAAAPGQPRVIAPWLAGQNPAGFPPASANVAPTGSTPPQAAATEPKRIRTVPIKPEQGAEAPAPRGQARSASAAHTSSDPASSRAEEPSGSGPLALAPQTPPAQPQRQAARTPNPPSPSAPATTASASPFPTPISGGGNAAPAAVAGAYAVQVTSQRSEADAQASFKSLQQQFPSVLGSRQPVIRRADLGEKGTYYRAQIPFGSQSEASEFCSSLKAAGGQCVVQRN